MAPHVPSNVAQHPATDAIPSSQPEERVIVWEVNLARGCLQNFSRVIDAHAIVMSLLVTVSFVGFLQPPKGWNVNPQSTSYMFVSPSVLAFIVFNSVSVFSAIAGLLFYIYCSYSTIFTFGSVPLPEHLDERGMAAVRYLRAALRRVALPSVQRRSSVLFGFLSSSLVCCVSAYICAGLAAIGPSKSLGVAVILPAIPGYIIIFCLLYISAAKMSMELKFDERLRTIWEKFEVKEPDIPLLDKEAMQALDPMPYLLTKLVEVFSAGKVTHDAFEPSKSNPWGRLDLGNKTEPERSAMHAFDTVSKE